MVNVDRVLDVLQLNFADIETERLFEFGNETRNIDLWNTTDVDNPPAGAKLVAQSSQDGGILILN